MARVRDYHAEYERRNEIAREQGFKSYGEKRYGLETGKVSKIELTSVGKPTGPPGGKVSGPQGEEKVKGGRDYKAEYERRNERAKEEGYGGYSQKRRVEEVLNDKLTFDQKADKLEHAAIVQDVKDAINSVKKTGHLTDRDMKNLFDIFGKGGRWDVIRAIYK